MGRKREAEDSQKNHKILLQEKKLKRKKRKQPPQKTSPELVETDEKFNNMEEEDKNKKSTGNKKRRREKDKNVDVGATFHITSAADNSIKEGREKEENKVSRKKKRKNERKNDDAIGSSDQPDTGIEDGFDEKHDNGVINLGQSGKLDSFQGLTETDREAEIKTGKSKKSGRNEKKKHTILKESGKVPESGGEAVPDNVYHISSGDKDFSKGMKKWIMEYHQSRPGLKTLQQRIDDFIVSHEEKLEQEREEKLARAAEGGWTVVVHHKGRKKTTDSETGIAVGSVAQAAVEDKMAKKKLKGVGQDFYRFQRREAQRNEIMMLQSKFEEDRKRIQQLRAARKFRPY